LSSDAGADHVVCPSCGSIHPADERFCPLCGMPLVHDADSIVDLRLDERRRRLRKIKPQFTEGELVRVAGGRNQAEAELIQGLLLEQGVPSMLRRTRGFDVPDMLAAGPRDVMVPTSAAVVARETLLEAQLIGAEAASTTADISPPRVLLGLLIAISLVAIVAWIGAELIA
jgi:hypothetical protein